MFYAQLILVGIATGSIYSLSALGIVLTYKATGIFNFAHGAIAVLVAYVLWQLNHEWHVPLAVAAPLALLVVGPGIGLALERVVFRPLQQARATTSEKLVATLGVFLLTLGISVTVWKGITRHGPHLVSGRSVTLPGQLLIGADQLTQIVLVLVIGVALWALFRFTHIGTEIRAVVDRRELAELSAVNANRVAALSWALGCGLAGLSGVLLAPTQLDPILLLLVVLDTYSIAVVARLVSLPVAAAAGILLLGVGQSLLGNFNFHVVPLVHTHLPSWLTSLFAELKPNLAVVLLFAALVLYRNLDEVGEVVSGARGLASRAMGRRARSGRADLALGALVAAALVVVPFLLSDITIAYGQVMLALMIVFVSIVCVTGFSGHITLGQAGFAGVGAYVSTRLGQAYHLPVVVAMLAGGAAAVLAGLVAGFPALRRRGLFLGLTTLAIGLLLYQFVFVSNLFAKGSAGLNTFRPAAFRGDRAFYWFELAWVGAMLLLARNLRSGRLGRILAAMRDSETGARAVGIDLRSYKLFIFAVSAFIAGIGGCLLAQQAQVFSPDDFRFDTSLLWFTAVVVAGAGSISGAVLGAAAFEFLNIFEKTRGVSQIVIALAALFIGRLPGGSLVGLLAEARDRLRVPRALQDAFAGARIAPAARPPTAPPAPPASLALPASAGPPLVPSTFARHLLEEVGS